MSLKIRKILGYVLFAGGAFMLIVKLRGRDFFDATPYLALWFGYMLLRAAKRIDSGETPDGQPEDSLTPEQFEKIKLAKRRFPKQILFGVPSALLFMALSLYPPLVKDNPNHPIYLSVLVYLVIVSAILIFFFWFDSRSHQELHMKKLRWVLRGISFLLAVASSGFITILIAPPTESIRGIIVVASFISTFSWIMLASPTLKPASGDAESDIMVSGALTAPGYEVPENAKGMIRYFVKWVLFLLMVSVAIFALYYIR